ncbi:pili assembly chaperone [Acinetobacter sp. NRRL B-65365]|uniref:type IV pilin protein n=1 Tax=Acinetobacter sp. NRRL B-65365 TaxID=1785092 RepID=UPI0007A044F5|nr:prepilin-type N-terminal cleavage/methylation domain-containing protein [Acinetobacter sp. NRRL B-65365]KYQ84588.1 pili assembly chaperone [Acinetobacter sp. NRRL B-65365]
MKKYHGFTLIELMVVLIIVTIFMAIAIPSYQSYMRKRDLAVAKQEALRISNELERFKSKNFSYKGFDASFWYAYDDNGTQKSYYDNTTGTLYLPIGATSTNAKYRLTLVDGGAGHKPLTMTVDDKGIETSSSKSVKGLNWAIKVERTMSGVGDEAVVKDPQNYDLLLTSLGLRCMTKTQTENLQKYIDCGSSDNVEKW